MHERQGKAITNFPATLPPADSDMASHVFKDPYLFDFLGTADLRREREIERALVDHIQHFLLELGAGFAFVGRQVVEYALRDLKKPIGVAEWETRLVRSLPEDLKSSLPTVEQLEAEVAQLEKQKEESGDGG